MATTIQVSSMKLPVTQMQEENPLPQFAALTDRPFYDRGLLPEEKDGFGKQTGFRVLPYKMQDRYSPMPEDKDVQTVVLENENLRATFLPEYGGRLYSLWDKRTQRENLYVNKGIILRNLALRNAWFSGGIEWNFGHFGHTYFTCDRVFFAACTDKNGEAFLRMYEYERCKQMTFQVDFHLPKGAEALTAHLCLYNRQDEAVPIFLWTNTAVPEEAGMQVYSGTDEVIAMHLAPKAEDSYFFHGRVPALSKTMENATDPTTLTTSAEYFFQNPAQTQSAFEAVQYADGHIFAERSTANFPYRKMFCWGTHTGGGHWQEFLAHEDSGAYLEVQAGISRTQEHSFYIAPRSEMHITQQFATASAPVLQGAYDDARAQMQDMVEELLPTQTLEDMHAFCETVCQKRAERILYCGHGWGALEKKRDATFLPAHLEFPEDTLTKEQAAWLSLLHGEGFGDTATFMVAAPWIEQMERVSQKTAALQLHLGIAYLERREDAAAKEALETSLALEPSPLARRCLAQWYWRRGDLAKAQEHMEEALLPLATEDALRPYAQEYILLLAQAGKHEEAFAFYRTLPPLLQAEERMQINIAQSAYVLHQDDFLQALFARSFYAIKEGEGALTDLWYLYTARQEARKRSVPFTQALVEEIRQTRTLPYNIHFGMA